MKFDDIPKEIRAEASERREMLIGMFLIISRGLYFSYTYCLDACIIDIGIKVSHYLKKKSSFVNFVFSNGKKKIFNQNFNNLFLGCLIVL